MTHSETLAFCLSEVKELVIIAARLLRDHQAHRGFADAAALYNDGYRRLGPFRAKSLELVREYRPKSEADIVRASSLAQQTYELMKSYMETKSQSDDVFTAFIDRIREIGAVLEMVSIPSAKEMATDSPRLGPGGDPKAVFVVHGHDESNTLKLQRYLRDDLKLRPIVLRYEPGKGRTLIEKFEQVAERASFAFVLLCPDDQVSCQDGSYAQARPNVVFELGWFYGRLGRSRVCILLKSGTKLHSDLDGISHVEFNDDVDLVSNDIRRELEDVGVLQT
jgi:predicted nucleotide-binding protein